MANCKNCGEAVESGVVMHRDCYDAEVKAWAELVSQRVQALDAAAAENKALRNELCLMCGRYENSHLGACDGCRWSKSD